MNNLNNETFFILAQPIRIKLCMNQPQIQNNKPDIVREMKVDIVNGFYKI